MKILLVNDYATPTGGAEIQMLALRDALRERGHDARLLASSVGGTASCADYKCFGTTSSARTLLQSFNPWALTKMRHILRVFDPDVVHVRIFLTQLSPSILRPLRNVPSLYHVVWYRWLCPTGTKLLPDGTPCTVPAGIACCRNGCVPWRDAVPLAAQMQLFRRWRGAFDLFVANSEAVKRRLVEAGIEPVEVVLNGVAAAAERKPMAATRKIVFAGRLAREKGVDVLLRAFSLVLSRFPDAGLTIAGEGPEGERLRRLTAELGIGSAVTLAGHLSRHELEQQFGDAWVQVIPSIWEEPCANVILEAMSRGTAVVATACGGNPEMVSPGHTGLLVPRRDPESLARALIELLDDRQRAEAMGRAGRELAARRFRLADCTHRFLELYEQLCAARHGDPSSGAAANLPGSTTSAATGSPL